MKVWLAQVQDVVTVMDEGLRSAACDVATQLRQAGRIVDLILEGKKMKQVFKVSAVCGPHCLELWYDAKMMCLVCLGCMCCNCPSLAVLIAVREGGWLDID